MIKLLCTLLLVTGTLACSSDKQNNNVNDSNDASITDGGNAEPADGAVNDGGAPAVIIDWNDADVTTVQLSDLETGMCGAPANDGFLIGQLATVACKLAHTIQMAGRFKLEGDYPGHVEILSKAYYGCIPVVEDYIGEDFWESGYDIKTVSPSPSTWAEGDRDVVCLLVNFDRSPLVGAANKR